MMSATLEEQLKLLHEKVDRILSLLEARPRPAPKRAATEKATRKKLSPLGPDDIKREQERFERLYVIWNAGEELKVAGELDAMHADELRRFADANNLNVTSKTSKQKVMKLIDGRFRERRQLMRTHFNRQPTTD
jgi:hypothetical protein